MTRPDARRAAIVAALADHVLAHGLVGASLRPLARAAGTSDRMLLYYFPDKAAVLAATLGEVAQRMALRLGARAPGVPRPLAQVRADLADLLDDAEFAPFLSVWLEIAALAGRGDRVYRTIGGAIGRGFLAWGAAQLDSPDGAARDADAARLLAMIEGMMLLRAIGLDDIAARAAAPD